MSRSKNSSGMIEEPVSVGSYTVFPKVLGRGAWSIVYAAVDNRSNMEVVAKVISKAKLKEKGTLATGEELREVAIMKMLPSHRNLVRMFETIETDKYFYLFLEKLPHGDLCDYILNAQNGKLPEAQCRKYLRQIIAGMTLLHSIGVAHRDVKPENMLLDPHDVLKITDFGLAKRHGKSRNIVTAQEELSKELVGTLRYASPEMFLSHFRGTTYDSFISDIWSVGVCLYIMLSGSFPYSAGPNADEKATWDVLQTTELVMPNEVSKEGLDLLRRLLCKDPRNRIRLHEVENHPWMRAGTPTAASSFKIEPPSPTKVAGATTEVDGATPNGSGGSSQVHQLLETIDALQSELNKYKDLAKSLSEELNKERTTRERLEKQVKEIQESHLLASMNGHLGGSPASSIDIPSLNTPTKQKLPNSSNIASQFTTRTSSPQRLPTSATTPTQPARNSPKRVTPAPRAAAPSPTRKVTPGRLGSPGRLTGPTTPSTTQQGGGRTAQQTTLQRSSPVVRFGTPVAGSKTAAPSARSGTSTPTRPGGVGSLASPLSTGGVGDAADLRLEQVVKYKGTAAIVRFLGTTGFAEGVWIGLELSEATGLNDGSCFIDKKRYFTCPAGHGVFVRRSQITV